MLPLLVACVTPVADLPAQSDETLWTDARAVLDVNCARCHTAGGQAPSFDDAATASSMAASMVAAVDAGRMPPPAPETSCAPYENSDTFTLDDAEIATLRAWADAGAPTGAAVADPPPVTAQSAPFDAELYGGQPYTPSFGADGNDYRCFLLPVGNEDAVFLTGMEALVDALPIVHHVVLFETSGTTGIPSDVEDPTQGFACSGLGAGGWEFLGAWAPGANPVIFPEGTGMKLARNAQLILQMHYFDSFEGADQLSDQSGYGVHLADSVERRVEQYPIGPTSFTIPAGDSAYVVDDSIPAGDPGLEVLGVWPHMHVLGAGFDERVVHSDGSESCLLHQDGWNFHNQVFAKLSTPLRLQTGDSLSVSCTYDNSASNPQQPKDPPEDVPFGEETGNEMCFGFTYVVDAE